MEINFNSYLLSSSSDLGLLGTPDLLHSVLPLLLLFPGDLGDLFEDTLSHQSVLGLELLSEVHGIIDEGESGALAATEVGLETEGHDTVRSALVHLGQLFADLRLGDAGPEHKMRL